MSLSTNRSLRVPEESAIQPPFFGPKLMQEHSIDIEELIRSLDRQTVFMDNFRLSPVKGE